MISLTRNAVVAWAATAARARSCGAGLVNCSVTARACSCGAEVADTVDCSVTTKACSCEAGVADTVDYSAFSMFLICKISRAIVFRPTFKDPTPPSVTVSSEKVVAMSPLAA